MRHISVGADGYVTTGSDWCWHAPSSADNRSRGFGLAAKTCGRTNATVAWDTSSPSKGAHMLTNHRSNAASAGTLRLALVGTGAVLATLAALVFFLLHPMGSDAAGANGPVI